MLVVFANNQVILAPASGTTSVCRIAVDAAPPSHRASESQRDIALSVAGPFPGADHFDRPGDGAGEVGRRRRRP